MNERVEELIQTGTRISLDDPPTNDTRMDEDRMEEDMAGVSDSDAWEWFKGMSILDEDIPAIGTTSSTTEGGTIATESGRPEHQAEPAALSRLQLLPTELRLLIYGFIWDRRRVRIHRDPRIDADAPVRYMITYTEKLFRDVESQKVLADDPADTNWFPINLMQTCTSIYHECMPFFYQRTQFVFDRTKVLRRFLSTVSVDAKAAIRHVELHHIMQNHPKFGGENNLLWKQRSDAGWMRTCNRLVADCSNLQVLHSTTMLSEEALADIVNPGGDPSLFLVCSATNHVRQIYTVLYGPSEMGFWRARVFQRIWYTRVKQAKAEYRKQIEEGLIHRPEMKKTPVLPEKSRFLSIILQ